MSLSARSPFAILALCAVVACGASEPSPLLEMPAPTDVRVRAAA